MKLTAPNPIGPRSRALVGGLAVAALLLIGLVAYMSLRPASCGPRADDPQGYLLRICEYVKANNIDVSPGDPGGYQIKRVEQRTEDGRQVVWVFLNCCYLGDIAVIDKQSGQVISFRVGAK
jgi:hypothetical protein